MKINLYQRCMLAGMLFFIYSSFAQADTYNCTANAGVVQLQYNMGNQTITDPDTNKPGYIVPDKTLTSASGNTPITCDCANPSSTYSHLYVWGDTPMTGGQTIGSYIYYDIPGNDNLQVGVKLSGKNGSGVFYNLPFGPIGNSAGKYRCSGINLGTGGGNTGGQMKVSLRIKKSFTGTSVIPLTNIASIYWNIGTDGGASHGPIPITDAMLTGSITVPQSCVINAGQTVVVNLGTLYSDQFTSKGTKPEGFTEKTFSVPVECNALSATANLSMHLSAQAATDVPSAIQTDHPGVGVVVADENNNPLIPNDSTGIPFVIDGDYKGNVKLSAYPVSTTQNEPEAGAFSALALLVVNFS